MPESEGFLMLIALLLLAGLVALYFVRVARARRASLAVRLGSRAARRADVGGVGTTRQN